MGQEHGGVRVENNEADQQYEARINGEVAFAAYEREGKRIIFTHTEVPEEMEGHGLAATIVKTALDDARAHHWSVIPLCPFVASYIRRHPQYDDIVEPAYREHRKPS